MGNINRRPSSSRTTSQPSAQWDEANVLRLISENKLAPKYTDKLAQDHTAQSVECPICFLDFAVINTVHCCKQYICTDCVVQMKATEGKGACPFCGNVEMHVSLIPLKEVKKAPPQTTPSKSKDERSNSLSETDAPSNRSSETSRVSLSYTTPEQEKKLRSLSMDADSSSAATSAVATKTDREALERQIREQRLQFDERDMAQAAQSNRNRGSYFSSARNDNSTANTPFLRGARYRMTTTSSSGVSSAGMSGPASPSQRFPAAGSAGRSGGNGNRALAGNTRLGDTIEGLLQARGGIGGISSIQQLEEIMLMEAIRLSMQDVPASAAEADNAVNPPAAPATGVPARTPSSTNTTANMTAMGSPYNSVSNTSSSTPVLPRSPARTMPPVPPNAQGASTSPARPPRRFPPRHLHHSSSSSHGSSEDLDEEYRYFQQPRPAADNGPEREDDWDYRLSAGSESLAGAEARESDLLSDEEEQLRMALAMSLASLETDQASQQREDLELAPHHLAASKNDQKEKGPSDATVPAPMVCADQEPTSCALHLNLNLDATAMLEQVDPPLSASGAEVPVLKISSGDTAATTSTEQSSA